MAKLIEYDVTGVEAGGGGGSVLPKPAVYPAKIVVCEHRDQKTDGTPVDDLRIALDLGGDYQWVWTYIGFGEASDWKLKEFVSALGLKDKGKIDPDKLKGKMLRVKVNADSFEGEPTAKAGRLMKAIKGDTLPEPSEDGDEPESQDDEESQGGGPHAAFTPTREDPDDDDVGSYDDWPDEDLEAEVSDRGLTVAGGRGKARDKWIKALRADDPQDGDEPADPETPADEQDDDYDEWEPELLEAEVKDRELPMPDRPKGRNAAERHKNNLIELLRKDNADNPFDPEAE